MKNSIARRNSFKSSMYTRTLLACALSLLLLALLSLPSSHSASSETKAKPEAAARLNYSSRAVAPKAAAIDVDETTPHLLAATYYSVKDELRAALMLNNKGPHPLDVQMTIFGANGGRLDVPTVTVEGNSFRELDLREYVGTNPSFREGSSQVFWRGHDLMLGAQVYLTDESRSLVFEEKLLELDDAFSSSRLEGVWWMPSHKCDARLVLSNTTDAALSVTANVDGSRPKLKEPVTLSLAPHETRGVDILRDLAGAHGGQLMEVGGVSLHHSGAAGALMARMLIEDPAEGYSSWVRFYDPQKGRSTKLHGAGLRLGSFAGERLTPVVFARNVGDAETVVTGRIPYTDRDGQAGVVNLPALRLAPGEAGTFNLDSALSESHVEQMAATAGLELEHTGAPGRVLVSAQSVSRNHNHVFQVPLWDIEGQRSSTGGYPWKVEGSISTVVYIKNVTDTPQQYVWELRHPGGIYTLGLKTVEPHQTISIDTRALRDNQVPDIHGRKIPRDATRGQVHWSTRGSDSLAMIGRAEQVDSVHGIASSYACQNCCPDSFYDALASDCLQPMFVQDTSQLVASQKDMSCYGTIGGDYTVSFLNGWQSFDAGVASVDGNGVAEGVSGGETQIQASWYGDFWDYVPITNSCSHRAEQVFANAACNVLVPEVTFDYAKLYDLQKDFSFNRVTMSAGASGHGEQICDQGLTFQVTAHFRVPDNARSVSALRSSVKVFGEPPVTNNYVVQGWSFANLHLDSPPKTGDVIITLARRVGRATPEVPHEIIMVTVAGDFDFGGFSSLANIKITCP